MGSGHSSGDHRRVGEGIEAKSSTLTAAVLVSRIRNRE